MPAYTEITEGGGYFVHSFKSPSVSGFTLKLLTHLIEYLGGLGLSRKIARDSNLFYLRDKRLLDAPTYYPLLEHDGGDGGEAVGEPALGEVAKGGVKVKGKVFRSVGDFVEAYKGGRVTPVEVAEAVLKAIDASNDPAGLPLLAIIKSQREAVLEQARASQERHAAGKPLSVLDGVPVAVKDELDALPYETNVGTSIISIHPQKDAFCIAKLRQAGAVIIGKANMHEIGLDVTNCNPTTGTARNPYNPDHFPGGSSGGSAGAVAAGLCPIAVGADGGGSIRIPAAYCGLFGLKPTTGRISETGAFPLAPTVSVAGPIAATAADLAIGYAIMAGPDPEDVNTTRQPAAHLKGFSDISSLKGLKIGVYTPYFEDADPVIVKACREMLDELVSRGAEIVEVTIPDLELLRVAHSDTIACEMLASTSGFPRNGFSYPTRTGLAVFESQLTSTDYIQAARAKTRGIASLRDIFAKVDVIATPSTGITAPYIPPAVVTAAAGLSDYTTSGKAMRFIFIANLLGIPAVSIPVGYGPSDPRGDSTAELPMGLQFQAKWWDEAVLLRLAHACEDALGPKRRAPRVWYDLLADAGKEKEKAVADGEAVAA